MPSKKKPPPSLEFDSLLESQIEKHWREHLPTMYSELQKDGTLQKRLRSAAARTNAAMYELTTEKKVPHNQAWEAIREEWAFLPAEKPKTRSRNQEA